MEPDLLQRPDMMFYAKLAQRKVGYVAGQMELTSTCGQKCAACDSWRAHKKGEITGTFSYEKINDIFQQLNKIPTFEHLSMTGGDPQHWEDPTCNANLDTILTWLAPTAKFSLQVNTALIVEPNIPLWQKSLSRIRVSLDGVNQATYRIMRGDDRDPREILDRMDRLAHPGLATNTCVTDYNIDEVPQIIEALNKLKNPPRKAMFLAVMDFKIGDKFWEKYARLKDIPSHHVETSFQEDVQGVREFVVSPEAADIPCYVGGITFHLKCNGDMYPCCLVGGEAIKTREEMKIGSVHENTIEQIQRSYRLFPHYKSCNSPCQKVCQWKQLQINRLAHAASKVKLTMP